MGQRASQVDVCDSADKAKEVTSSRYNVEGSALRGAVTSDDFGHARDDRAAQAVRVLDRNDSHRFWFEPAPANGLGLTGQIGNKRAASMDQVSPRLCRRLSTLPTNAPQRAAAFHNQLSI